jgi:hypothetical protein
MTGSHRDGWRGHAMCAEAWTDVDFFAADDAEIAAAIDVCSICPVRRVCLDDVLRFEQRAGYSNGVFGGLSSVDRDDLLKGLADPIDVLIAGNPQLSLRRLADVVEAELGRRVAPSTISRRRQRRVGRAA